MAAFRVATVLLLFAVLLLSSVNPTSAQQDWPSRTIKLIVPFAAGGNTDILGRLIADRIEKKFGAPMVVENRPGAGAKIGAEAAAKSPGDGYTFFIGTASTHGINSTLYKKLRYDPITDFEPVLLVAKSPLYLFVSAKLPASSVTELLEYATRTKAKLSYGSVGVGTPHHLAGELFKRRTGLDMVHVPYRGSAPAITDLMTGSIQLMFDATAIAQAQEGALRVIRNGSKKSTLSELFGDDSPHIEFGDGSLLIYSHLYELPHGQKLQPFPARAVESWNWKGTDISKESQGTAQRADSIQRRVINDFMKATPAYDVIFDDDGRGEIADVVAIRATDELISVTLVHCKYSSGAAPGARVNDLYEVCGQTQKSVRWRDRPNRMFQHILQREKSRMEKGGPSRFQVGNAATVSRWRARWQEFRYEYRMEIVQPGLSQGAMTEESLHLIASTQTYLIETRAIPLRVIGSA